MANNKDCKHSNQQFIIYITYVLSDLTIFTLNILREILAILLIKEIEFSSLYVLTQTRLVFKKFETAT